MPNCSPHRDLVSSWAVFTHDCRPTRYQVSSWATFGMQLDTWYRVDPLKDLNSIPSIELVSLWGSTRYQVSSCSFIWEQLDTWYRIVTSLGENYGVVRTVRVRLTWTPSVRASWMPLLLLWCLLHCSVVVYYIVVDAAAVLSTMLCCCSPLLCSSIRSLSLSLSYNRTHSRSLLLLQ